MKTDANNKLRSTKPSQCHMKPYSLKIKLKKKPHLLHEFLSSCRSMPIVTCQHHVPWHRDMNGMGLHFVPYLLLCTQHSGALCSFFNAHSDFPLGRVTCKIKLWRSPVLLVLSYYFKLLNILKHISVTCTGSDNVREKRVQSETIRS